jgi:phage terminase large subunit-like protein
MAAAKGCILNGQLTPGSAVIGIIDFCDHYIKLNEKGKPWSLSKHQRRVLSLAFRFNAVGKLLYRLMVWSEPKKSGKTFVAACVLIWWAITHASTEIVVAANDEEQSVGRVFATAAALIKVNPELQTCAKVLSNEIRFTNGTMVTAIASEYKGSAGSRHSLVVYDELWGYGTENLRRLYEELTPPPTEENAFVLIVTYAGFDGESELLQSIYNRGLTGKRLDKKLECYRADQLFMFWSHKRRQPWQLGREGRAYYDEQRRILRPGTFKRLHENEWVSSESAFITAEAWDAITDYSINPLLTGGSLYLGLDLGIKSDYAALVAVAWHEDGKRLVIANHKVWKPTKSQPVNLADVESHIKNMARLHSVRKIYCDPYQAAQMIQNLQTALGRNRVEEYAQTVGNTVRMGETLFSLIRDKNLVGYESDELRGHMLNAVGLETPRGVRLVKSTASKKIDLAVALAMACVGAIETGKSPGLSDVMMITDAMTEEFNRMVSDLWQTTAENIFD